MARWAANWMLLHMALPLAISFFTFEQITYLVSATASEAGTGDFLSYAMFITFFPHLIAGPIVRYREIYPQFNRRSVFRLAAANVTPGLMIFAIGLFKKVIIADTFRAYVEPIFDGKFPAPPSPTPGAATLAFTLQIYFDFSGYSDMAIGLARMFNVRFPENFDSPYQSTSLIEFWRRWHITLSFFLRDYVYIPLGGNRKGELRQQLNLFLTMLAGRVVARRELDLRGLGRAAGRRLQSSITSGASADTACRRLAGWALTFWGDGVRLRVLPLRHLYTRLGDPARDAWVQWLCLGCAQRVRLVYQPKNTTMSDRAGDRVVLSQPPDHHAMGMVGGLYLRGGFHRAGRNRHSQPGQSSGLRLLPVLNRVRRRWL